MDDFNDWSYLDIFVSAYLNPPVRKTRSEAKLIIGPIPSYGNYFDNQLLFTK